MVIVGNESHFLIIIISKIKEMNPGSNMLELPNIMNMCLPNVLL